MTRSIALQKSILFRYCKLACKSRLRQHIRSQNTFLEGYRSAKGFTLMELLIAVVIVGILASIAYPAYLDYLYRTRRSDGQAALMNLATYMEHYYTENNAYTGATLAGLGLTNASQQGYYTVAISALAASSYTLTATPVAPQSGDTTCPTITLTNTNVKGPTLTCWQ